jgi:hypothetical protein
MSHTSIGPHLLVPSTGFGTKRHNVVATICFGCVLQVSPTCAGDLLIAGKLDDYRAQIKLDDYSPKGKGDAVIELHRCVPNKENDDLTEDDYHGTLASWTWAAEQVEITLPADDQHKDSSTFFLAPSATESGEVINWRGQVTGIGDIVGTFEGQSSAKVDTAIALPRFCDDSTENPGLVVALVRPELLVSAKKYFRAQGWKLNPGTPLSAPSSSKNAVLFDLPVGSERGVIEQLKKTKFVFDANRDYIPKSVPQLGWVLLPRDRLSSTSISGLQTEVQGLVDSAFSSSGLQVRAVPKSGNVFELVIRGPVSKFIEEPKLPGYWIDTKLQVLVDPQE